MFLQLLLISFLGHSEQAYQPQGLCGQKVHHTYYSICYSQEHRQALWTNHKLTQESVNGRQRRTDDFREDPSVDDPVNERAFWGTGFDRGHLVPAGDMKKSETSMSESFFMTNMSPQRPGFNRGIWRSLERRIRKWVRRDGEAYVVTAPVLTGQEIQLDDTDVSIPDFYYKIAYFPAKKIMKAFLIPHENIGNNNFYKFSISVDELENLTGFDFFAELPDSIEEELEAINYYD